HPRRWWPLASRTPWLSCRHLGQERSLLPASATARARACQRTRRTREAGIIAMEAHQAVEPVNLEYIIHIRMFLGERIRFSPTTPQGGRFSVPRAHGEILGPRLQGKGLPYSGAEWPRGRADNVFDVNAHYTLEASDGTP